MAREKIGRPKPILDLMTKFKAARASTFLPVLTSLGYVRIATRRAGEGIKREW